MINKKIKKIVIIMLLIIILFPYATTLAVSQADAGRAIASYAYDFCIKFGLDSGNNQTIYDHDNGLAEERKKGYNLEPTTGTAQRNPSPQTRSYNTPLLAMDCVAFVAMVIHQSLGFEPDAGNNWFICPPRNKSYDSKLERVTGELQPGDIGRSDRHVLIYLGKEGGDYTVAESLSQNPDFKGPVLTNTNISSYDIYRVKSSAVEGLSASEIKTDTDGSGLVPSSGSGRRKKTYTESDFHYNGIPDGTYSVTAGWDDYIVDTLFAIIDYIIGIMTLSSRMAYIGWAAIIENMVSATIKKIDDDYNNDNVKEQDPVSYTVEDDTVTVESIIFNDLDVFDVNFFEKISEDLSTETE